MSVKRQLFVSCHARGLELGAEQIGLGLPLILGFTLSSQPNATALPTRYNVARNSGPARWYGRQAAWLDNEALSLSPIFKLSRQCSTGLAALHHQHAAATVPAIAAAPNALQQLRSISSHSLQAHLADSSSSSSATESHCTVSTADHSAAAAADMSAAAADMSAAAPADSSQLRDQLQQQYAATAAAGTAGAQLPWLGASLCISGYTKKGYMRGGGKEQNQDRGLIMQPFRSPSELLLGVFDGHGSLGHLVSSYLLQHLPAVIMQKLVAAAAALHTSSSSSSNGSNNRSSSADNSSRHQRSQHGGKQQQQQQQQLQYVVIPDHRDGSSSSWMMDLHEQQQQQQQKSPKQSAIARRGRLVSRHKVVHQPEHVQLDDSSSSSSGLPGEGPQIVLSSLLSQPPLTKGLLQDAFAETDHMLNCSGINVLDSGSTGIITHIDHDKLTTAWVGDSRAIVGRRVVDSNVGLKGSKQQQQQLWQQWGDGSSSSSSAKWQVIQLSDDHKPERPDEQLRILLNGGRVEQMKDKSGAGVGPYRVWFKQIDYPGLAMSRAFGDAASRRIGVTVEPQLFVHRLTAADQILVAASDGVWEYMTNQEAIDLVVQCNNATTAARKLVEAAEERWQATERGTYIDDITALVVMATPTHNQPASKL